jgi:glutamate synthase (NADPH/NADH) large chain
MVPSGTSDRGLGDPTADRSNCGVGVVMNLDGASDRSVVRDGLDLLANLEHRGTTGAEENTGDGAGITLEIPHDFFADTVDATLPDPGAYGVGTLFLPDDPEAAAALRRFVEERFAAAGLDVLAWRSVPRGDADLGATALRSEPEVVQVFVESRDGLTDDALRRRLYVARRVVETAVDDRQLPDDERLYFVSLDPDVVVYKGLLLGTQLGDYFPDLRDERVRSTFAMVHARFSTNTLGAWHLAHPYRRIIHNGEFNTIQGNVNWMRARETDLASETFGDDLQKLLPVVDDPDQSDTASVDNVLELLLLDGRSLPHALRTLVPEAWRDDANDLSPERRAWYDYHASVVEPWDGPALVAATDGDRVGAVLDRNGLRPCRYDVLEDDTLVLASEVGAIDTDPAAVRERGRLQPGELFLADPEEGRIVPDDEIFDDLTDPTYAEWVDDQQVALSDLVPDPDPTPRDRDGDLRSRQALYGYTHDELDELLAPMAETGTDPVGSMGDDTPLSVLSGDDRPLASYFKQLFAQVTNPPLDYIREELVTSLESRLGHQRNLLGESPAHARQLVLDSPILTDAETAAIRELDRDGLSTAVLDLTYDPEATDLRAAVEALRERANDAAATHDVVVLSDRSAGPDRVPIPSLLAVGGVHHHLVDTGRRNRVGLVVESADPRTVHQVATLVGYGAGAVNPYLAYRTIEDLVAGPDGPDAATAVDAYVGALEDGLLKTMSKMGISTVESYRGAQIFEAVGLADEFVDEYFTGTENRTDGVGIDDVEADLRRRHTAAFGDPEIERTGEFRHRTDGTHHAWNPEAIGTLQEAVREGDYEAYREFAALANDHTVGPTTLRGLLAFDDDRESVPLSAVEPVDSIVERFETAAMSLGSLSPEMHETNAIAMNRLGGSANTGEGGEPTERFGTERGCSTKQVASGRFGVTAEYLAAADELQIKMAQGSKPGEGGHLPGEKVNEMIAGVRHSTPGVGLISPAPQHDIYSIEDLKQLIHDLRAANPEADVNVKLVAEAGIGTIAAGVAKANADVVHVSGHSGGTGASPKTSIKHAGLPWELGVAEANQILRETGLRSRIKITTDGGMKTGRDVAVAALLGAEGYTFGTASLVTAGCVMARQCHQNTCPVGIATQDEDLRDRFPGEPRHVATYMRFLARDLREIMAELGFRSVEEMVGRVDALRQRDDLDDARAASLDLSALLVDPPGDDRTKTREQDHEVDDALDWSLIEAAAPALEERDPVGIDAEIGNGDRAVGATLSNRVVAATDGDGLAEDTIVCRFEGAAGQSFGAFLTEGVTMTLDGPVNDYLGKGLSGGKLIVRTPESAGYDAAENVLAGNVGLYGATDGECYVNGRAGERFAVRNSGVRGVVEGVGDHGCEYMTGGAIVVLGETGKNFAAGMSGGVAYVYDPDDEFADRVNRGMVSTYDDLDPKDEQVVRRLVENHAAYTDSERARDLLADDFAALEDFVAVLPDAYADVIERRDRADVRDTQPQAASDALAAHSVATETLDD